MREIELALRAKPEIMTGQSSRTEVQLENSLAALQAELQGHTAGTVVVWMMQAVVWGTWDGAALTFVDDAEVRADWWQEIRIFNETEELHLRRCDKGLVGRWLNDAGGEVHEYVDAIARFWGSREQAAGKLMLADRPRKLCLNLPEQKELADYYGLVTRNYIGISPVTHQAGYRDYRFVQIAPADVKEG